METNNLLELLQNEKELIPSEHDGSYEIMRATIEAYSKLESYDDLDYRDLDLIYLMAVGTFTDGLERKKDRVRKSRLAEEDKERLLNIMDSAWDKACYKKYSNVSPDRIFIGMFGSGFLTFKRFESDEWTVQIREVLKMIIDIKDMDDDNEIYDRAERVLNKPIKGLKAASVSVMLHCIKPYIFPILNGNEGMGDIYGELGLNLNRKREAVTYIENSRKIKSFRDANLHFKNYRVFDLWARKVLADKVKSLWPSLDEYSEILTKEQWIEFIEEDREEHPEALKMLMCMYELGGEATCKQLENELGESYSAWKSRGSYFAKRACTRYELEPYTDDKGIKYYFATAFQGYSVADDESIDGSYAWVLRQELSEALEEIDYVEEIEVKTGFDNNIILYGPPGTGKTYNSARYAVAICDDIALETVNGWDYDDVLKRYDELKAEGRIAFTTFHQSYGYEDFIEGIKPVVSDDGVENGDSLQYVIADGSFKAFCKDSDIDEVNTNAFDEAWDKLVKAAEENENQYTFTRRTGKTITATLMNEERFRVIWNGGSYNDLSFDAVKKQWIEGENPELEKLKNGTKWLYSAKLAVIDELVKEFGLPKKVETKKRNKVFIIDEINRGNISKIFGELITLIEQTKRIGAAEEMTAKLPYSGDYFGVPKNVYILGTMNTADRSIALMDTALRRRFTFVEMMPDADVIRKLGIDLMSQGGKTLDIAAMLETINERISFLYDREHTIGHAFFTKLKNEPGINTLAGIFEKSIIPLLQEYFYEDYQKIQLVLGDNSKTDSSYKFIKDIKVVQKDIFKGSTEDVVDIPEKKYEVNKEAFTNIESYIEIM